MKILVVGLLLISNFSSANEFSESDKKYLKNIPSTDPSALRWMMPADGWQYKEQHLFKGKAFRIFLNGSEFSQGVDIYPTSDLKGKAIGKISGSKDVSFLNGVRFCDNHVFNRPIEKDAEALECRFASCRLVSNHSADFQLGLWRDSEFLLNKEKYQACANEINLVTKKTRANDKNWDSIYRAVPSRQNTDYSINLYFGDVENPGDKNFLTVKINKKDYFLDIRPCKKSTKQCDFLDITFSDFEKDWILMSKIQEKRDNLYLNILIEELLPCVINKDKECIRKFFPKPDDEFLEYKIGDIPEIKIDEEFIAELRACLDYKSLLPHRLGSKGIKKVCIFGGQIDNALESKVKQGIKIERHDKLLLNIAYPEAVRIGETFTIYGKAP